MADGEYLYFDIDWYSDKYQDNSPIGFMQISQVTIFIGIAMTYRKINQWIIMNLD